MPESDKPSDYLALGTLVVWIHHEHGDTPSVSIYLRDPDAPTDLTVTVEDEMIFKRGGRTVDQGAIDLVRSLNAHTPYERMSCPHGCLTVVRRPRGLRRLLRRRR
ncbi:hypothetical protein [Parafrankia elaeagni]|uniref:hypothetical protein n=1 Tax=Parafrankia elaeagni TaxID=222534 RepID=UPI00036BF378|nr:hypothetical protein [Parafrankia elaeagni]